MGRSKAAAVAVLCALCTSVLRAVAENAFALLLGTLGKLVIDPGQECYGLFAEGFGFSCVLERLYVG